MLYRILRHILLIFALVLAVQGQSRAITPNDSVVPVCPVYSLQPVDYQDVPWISRTSRSFTFSRGLLGRHVNVWASHGRYFDNTKDKWMWQRPFLFCTTEDLLSQSFVYPFLIPMLENAGAVVYTPRERDYQDQEAIIDNDGSYYGTYDEQGQWGSAGTGFGMTWSVLNDTIQPFTMGTARMAEAGSDAKVLWMPRIPETGRYAVYVSYATVPGSVNDACYTVHHAGSTTTFRVNQQMGGGTWAYLGTFLFDAGQSDRNCVVLDAQSSSSTLSSPSSPAFITADAVRFGGGRGMVERSRPEVWETYEQRTVQLLVDSVLCDSIVTDTLKHYRYGKGVKSGLPRYLEAARYYAQWAGLEDSLYNRGHGLDDYRDDLRSRSYLLNRLAGGSCFVPDTVGRRVPIELQLALHTDAGFHRNQKVYGSLSIATDYNDDGQKWYRTGLSRSASQHFAGRVLHNIGSEMSRLYGVSWPEREQRVANYSETRSPQVPSTILELLSHQNYTDMTYAHDPNFKFDASRTIYKSILREIYEQHQMGEPVIQPLPVTSLSAVIEHSCGEGQKPMARLSWCPQNDPLEPSAQPTEYVLYIRQGANDWDEGTLTKGQPSINVSLEPGVHYQFRVSALNAGGESFPSAPVSVYYAGPMAPTVLLVDAFDRLSGPARVETADSLGFDLRRDVGVSYGVNTSFCGAQKNFQRTSIGKPDTQALGYSTSEYVGQALAGNAFDGIALHTEDIMDVIRNGAAPPLNIASMSRSAFDSFSVESLRQYAVIDYIAGLQSDKSYNLRHYDVFGKGTSERLADYAAHEGRLLVSGSYLGEADSLFLAQTLHAQYRATLSHADRGVFSGLGFDLPVYNQPNTLHYPCQESHVLEPADEQTFSAFSYASTDASPAGFSAGIVWPHGVVMAFPYDCLCDTSVRRSVMGALLKYLIPQ